MKLYLVQHGEAKPREVDPDRHLTEKGIRDARRIAAFLKPLKISVDAVWHSGKPRAAETADILAQPLNVKRRVKERKDLSPNDPVGPTAEKILSAGKDLMIVGHLPFLTKLASSLITGREDEEIIAFQYAGVVCLERAEGESFAVRWMVTPELLNAERGMRSADY